MPRHWRSCKLGDVIDATALADTADLSEISPDAWVLELDDIEKDTSVLLGRRTFAEAASRSNKIRFRKGDILYGRLRPYLNKVIEADDDGYCTTEILPLRPTRALHGRYLFYWLKHPSFAEYAESVSHGLNMPRLGKQHALAAPIPLPPVAEQIRIAEKLDLLFARAASGRESLGRASELIDRLRTAALDAAIAGELTETWRQGRPRDWRLTTLAELADIQSGVMKNTKDFRLTDKEVPYLRVANVQRGHLDLTDVRTIRIPVDRLGALLLKPGDILYTEGGDADKLGRGWIWEGQLPRCSFQNHIFRARLRDNENQPKYVSWWSNTRGAAYFQASAKQTTNLASINKTVLAAMPIEIPPVAEQIEIVKRVESLQTAAEDLSKRVTGAAHRIAELVEAALRDAFNGRLIPPAPGDIPVSVTIDEWHEERATQSVRVRRTPRRKSNMISSDELFATIRKLANSTFSFDDIRVHTGNDYDSLRDALFGLLAEQPPRVRQIFDREAQAIRFTRIDA